tara:strand:+ start:2755 stop:3315 length:561 start_codon:yes stop_codon:yes gene_type:complete
MQFEKAIHKIDSAVPKETCSFIIKYINKVCKTKAKLLVGNKNIEIKSQRDVYDYGLHPNNNDDKPYIKVILDIMNKELIKYMNTFTYLQQLKVQDINLLKYEVGNFYGEHIDAYHTVNRQISFIINLNNEYEGGSIDFFHPTERKAYKKINFKTGDLILFPSNFMYPHRVNPITKGTRYSIVSWYG